jgi:hypothetical protein
LVAAKNRAFALRETGTIKRVPRIVDERARALRIVRRRRIGQAFQGEQGAVTASVPACLACSARK